MSQKPIRTFVCFEISEALRDCLAQVIDRGRRIGEPVSWVRPKNIHVTLKFLGDIDPARVPDISRRLQEIAQTAAPLHLGIDRLGAFPNFRRPRVFWAGTEATPEALAGFVENVEDALAKLGFAREKRPFTPHLTIARIKRPGVGETSRFLEQYEFKMHELTFENLIFMRSELRPGGSVYTPLATLPLRAGEA